MHDNTHEDISKIYKQQDNPSTSIDSGQLIPLRNTSARIDLAPVRSCPFISARAIGTDRSSCCITICMSTLRPAPYAVSKRCKIFLSACRMVSFHLFPALHGIFIKGLKCKIKVSTAICDLKLYDKAQRLRAEGVFVMPTMPPPDFPVPFNYS